MRDKPRLLDLFCGGGYGHGITVEYARFAMGVNWYMPQGALHQAIPPVYTEYIGRQLIAFVQQHETLIEAWRTP